MVSPEKFGGREDKEERNNQQKQEEKTHFSFLLLIISVGYLQLGYHMRGEFRVVSIKIMEVICYKFNFN